jgi:3-keto-5-aminohexanoate cleavage enzyme
MRGGNYMNVKLKEKVIVTAALTGDQPVREGGPNVPITPAEIAEEAYNCYKAGASMVHIHARDKDTKLVTHDLSIFDDILGRIKEQCNVVIQITGAIGGSIIDPVTKKEVFFTEEQRLGLLNVSPKPDAFPTPMGSMDLIGSDGRSSPISNSVDFLKQIIPIVIEKKIAWEMEIWDTSYLYNAVRLAEEGVFDRNVPIWLNYCMGHRNGIQDANPRHLVYMSEEGKRLFPHSIWALSVRGKNHFNMMALAVALGCDIVRTGFEDHFYLPNGKMAKSNVEMIESIARIVRDLGREPATVEEAREILRIPG